MDWVDGVDAFDELLSRRWKRRLAVCMALVALLWPDEVSRALAAYGEAKARQIVNSIVERNAEPLPSAPTRSHDAKLPSVVNGQVAVPTGGQLKVPTLR